MSAEQVFKDTSAIYARLFDHRAAIHGEVNHLIKELEIKRNDRELMLLNKCHEKTRHVQIQLHPECVQYLQHQIESAAEKINDLTQNLSEMIKKDSSEEVTETRPRSESVADEFAAEWDEFMREMNEKCQKVDNEYNEKMKHLSDDFSELKT
ncbi:Biogenesis of lysosome-related organelles complex 1 subunit 5 [Trichoplax sp. H2]|uniref:Biogenesis of lysosome-related organelles complex 1 subunit 5 n=1 Tax=Trichoplax adhaerens TaxID=10228 RepID=B3S9W5_TRIAD|nr:hypothetical protein TRIADDRAFT_61049 [Trichoplax adhaerens]EDV20407.1 hypothetical protein TRIADDRAFT_61049 [Trichoplax adhaerens]RDD38407.1 Biogenesis of lysosome-related organelles complex 1 subunit 5 [Trichoplax sp. H2]|eukprot:XP_002117101.1 hypothetical protein TRIADDRAFT_61049 [Trichoplax adhaerens]